MFFFVPFAASLLARLCPCAGRIGWLLVQTQEPEIAENVS